MLHNHTSIVENDQNMFDDTATTTQLKENMGCLKTNLDNKAGLKSVAQQNSDQNMTESTEPLPSCLKKDQPLVIPAILHLFKPSNKTSDAPIQ